MKTRQMLVFTTLGISLFCIAGCFEKQQFDKQRYWLDVQRPETISNKTSAAILSIEPFSIDSAFRTNSIVYKKTAYEFESDFYTEYLIPPAKMITEQTRQWLSNSGLFVRVLQPGSTMKPTHILEGHISKIYIDTSANNQVAAQLEISLYLLNNKRKQILLGKTYTTTEPMDSAKAEDYFKAMEVATAKILQQYENDLDKLLK
jgi:ABC-type uncharacterized transport system auxiliary subunit